jgi:Ras-related protein Ral-A
VPFILVGNKAVPQNEAAALADEWNCKYIETSAKTRQNIDEVYTELMRQIRDRKAKQEKSEGKSSSGKCVIL